VELQLASPLHLIYTSGFEHLLKLLHPPIVTFGNPDVVQQIPHLPLASNGTKISKKEKATITASSTITTTYTIAPSTLFPITTPLIILLTKIHPPTIIPQLQLPTTPQSIFQLLLRKLLFKANLIIQNVYTILSLIIVILSHKTLSRYP
jgi:hypothetical protein